MRKGGGERKRGFIKVKRGRFGTVAQFFFCHGDGGGGGGGGALLPLPARRNSFWQVLHTVTYFDVHR